MNNYLAAVLVSIIILAATAGAVAQTPSGTGSLRENRVVDSTGGYSFAVPQGWTKNDGNGAFALINESRQSMIVVKAHNHNNFDAYMNDNSLEVDGLQQVGPVKDFDGTKYFRAAKNSSEGILVVDFLIMFSPHGGGVTIFSFSDQPNSNANLQTAAGLAGTVRFSRPQESGATAEWQTFLRGKHLIYLKTSGSFSDRVDIYLCPSGVFYYKGNSSAHSNESWRVTTQVNGNQFSGRWRVTSRGGTQLILEAENGQTREYHLSRRQSAGEISLNDTRYFIKTDAGCQ